MSKVSMKRLEAEFTKNGVEYTRIDSSGRFAIYRRTSEAWTDYEVIRIQETAAGEMTVTKDGEEKVIKFEAAERYPSTNSWGADGWTLQSEGRARQKMAQLVAQSVEDAKNRSIVPLIG